MRLKIYLFPAFATIYFTYIFASSFKQFSNIFMTHDLIVGKVSNLSNFMFGEIMIPVGGFLILSILFYLIFHVGILSTKKKMFWINTFGIIAPMKNAKIFVERAMMKGVTKTMSIFKWIIFSAKIPVTMMVAKCGPFPTTIWSIFINFFPKSFFKCFVFHAILLGCFTANGQSYFKGPAIVETPTIVATAGGTTTLTKDSNTIQNFTGVTTQTVQLPAANTLPLGRSFEIWNSSTGAVTVNDATPTLVKVLQPGNKVRFRVTDIGTAAGVWIAETITAAQVTNTPSGNVAATNVQAAINELGGDIDGLTLRLKRATSTGVIGGLDITANVGNPATIDIAPGKYDIADQSDVDNPDITEVTFPGATAVALTYLATHDTTYILLNDVGGIVQQTTFPTPNQRRQYAFVGRVNHSNRTTVSFTNTFPDYKISPVASFYDLVDALAPFKMDDGLQVTANGANLSFNRSGGKVFFRADNYTTDKDNPHTKTYGAQTLQPFRKITQTATVDVADVTVLDPANYDNAGTVTAVGGGTSRSTIQRIYLFKSGAVRVAYGQTIYSTFADAKASVGKEAFVGNPTLDQTAVLIALVVLRRNCTSLLDTACALIVPASRFGGTGGGGGGGGGDPKIEVSSTQTLANAAVISVQDVTRQRVKIQSTGGNVNVTVPTCTRAAQELYILGMSDTNTVTINTAANINVGGSSVTFTNGKQMYFVCDLTNTIWRKVGGF